MKTIIINIMVFKLFSQKKIFGWQLNISTAQAQQLNRSHLFRSYLYHTTKIKLNSCLLNFSLASLRPSLFLSCHFKPSSGRNSNNSNKHNPLLCKHIFTTFNRCAGDGEGGLDQGGIILSLF